MLFRITSQERTALLVVTALLLLGVAGLWLL